MERYEVDQSDWEQREVYAKFGLTVYAAQVLEAQVVNHLAVVRSRRHRQGQSFDVDAVYRRLFSGSFGQNLGETKDLLGEDWPLAEDLAEVLRSRNELIHHFWRRRILKMRDGEGRQELVDELDALAERFLAMDRQLTELTLEQMAEYGLSREWVESMAEKLAAGEDPPPEWEAY